MFHTIGYVIHMKKAIDFLCFYLPNFIDILLFGSSNPTGMIILPLGIYKLILKIFLIKSKKSLEKSRLFAGHLFCYPIMSSDYEKDTFAFFADGFELS